MKVVNLTPHTVNVVGQAFPQSGHVARVDVAETAVQSPLGDIPAVETQSGAPYIVDGDGNRQSYFFNSDTIYIVSTLVRDALQFAHPRALFASPYGLVRDEQGRITGAQSLAFTPNALRDWRESAQKFEYVLLKHVLKHKSDDGQATVIETTIKGEYFFVPFRVCHIPAGVNIVAYVSADALEKATKKVNKIRAKTGAQPVGSTTETFASTNGRTKVTVAPENGVTVNKCGDLRIAANADYSLVTDGGYTVIKVTKGKKTIVWTDADAVFSAMPSFERSWNLQSGRVLTFAALNQGCYVKVYGYKRRSHAYYHIIGGAATLVRDANIADAIMAFRKEKNS